MAFKKTKKMMTKVDFSKENLPLDPALKEKYSEKIQKYLKTTDEAVAFAWLTKANLRDAWILLKQPREFFEAIVDMMISGQTDLLAMSRLINLNFETELTAGQLAAILRRILPRFDEWEHEERRPKREAREARLTEMALKSIEQDGFDQL